MRQLAQEVKHGSMQPDEIDEAAIERCLYTAGQPILI